MVYAATQSEPQRVIRWRIIIKESGPNIQHIAGIDNNRLCAKQIYICVYRQEQSHHNESSVSREQVIHYY